MLNCAEQMQIRKYKTHASKTLKTAGVQIIMLKHPTKHKKQQKKKTKTKTINKNKNKKTPRKQNKSKNVNNEVNFASPHVAMVTVLFCPFRVGVQGTPPQLRSTLSLSLITICYTIPEAIKAKAFVSRGSLSTLSLSLDTDRVGGSQFCPAVESYKNVSRYVKVTLLVLLVGYG